MSSTRPRNAKRAMPLYVFSSDEEREGRRKIIPSSPEPSSPPGSESDASLTPPRKKRKLTTTAPGRVKGKDINSVLMASASSKKKQPAPHPSSLHSVLPVALLRDDLLTWYDRVKGVRGMPWRKDYDPSLSAEDKTQRAYEVLVSEIMLQQTQM